MMRAKSFPYLVYGLFREQHQDNLYAMQQKVDVGYTTLWRWMRGLVRRYQPDTLDRFCRVHGLKELDVLDLIHRDERARRAGAEVPVPDTSWIIPGPKPHTRRNGKPRRRGGAAGLLLLSLAAGSVPAYAGTMNEPPAGDNVPIIGSGRRRPWRRRLALPTTWAA